MGLIGLIASVFVLAFSIIISVVISQPFTAALVRLRANYLPKAISLDQVLEDGSNNVNGVRGVTPRAISGYFLRQRQSTAKIGPVITGIFPMIQRAKMLEGWPGVYKGAAPVVFQLSLLGFVSIILYSTGGLGGAGAGQYRAAPSGPGQFGFWSNLFFMFVTSIVTLPLNVITNRAIVHPRILTFRNPRKSLDELLSYSEFAQPWRLYQTPGLLATVLLHITWIGMITRIVRHITVPALGGLPPSSPASSGDDTYVGPSTGSLEVTTFGLAIFLAWCVFSVIILSPLECVIVRLSVQRPERQQPLHLAYARAPSQASSAGPAPYNNQAQVSRESQVGSYQDNTSTKSNAAETKKQSIDDSSRPSFAITDEDEEEAEFEGKQKPGEAQKESLLGGIKVDTSGSADSSYSAGTTSSQERTGPPPSRTLGRGPSPPFETTNTSTYSSHSDQMPAEPVIALRPCDEPQSAEEAALAQEEGFGAPTVERYTGMIDCLNKLVDEEGIEALYRGAWVTLLGVLVGNFG